MKNTKKTPKIVLVVLITLLVVAGLFIFRAFILGKLGIGAELSTETNLSVKYANTVGLLKDTLVNVSGATETATNQKYVGLSSAVSPTSCSSGDVSPACVHTGTATATSTSSAVSNGCTNLSSVKATVSGSPFHLGLSKTVSSANEINFGTKDQVLDSLTYADHGLWLSRQNTFLRVKSIPGNNDPVDVTIKFTGANLNNQSIKLVNKDPLESGDTYSVDTATNTATFHFTANNDDSDIDGLAIYFYCGASDSATAVTTAREGTISGSFDLGATKNVTKVKLNPITTRNLNNNGTGCIRTDINAQVSNDNQTWTNEQTSGSSTELAFPQAVQARYVKYIFTLKSCNATDTPKIASASVVGYGISTSTSTGTQTGSSTPIQGTCNTSSVFTWKACVDGMANIQFKATDPIVTILKYNYNAIGKHADCASKYNDTAPLGTVTGSLEKCNKVELSKVEVLGGSGKAEYVTLSSATAPFKIDIKDNGGGPVDYLITLKCAECDTQTPTVTTTVSCGTSGCNTITTTPTVSSTTTCGTSGCYTVTSTASATSATATSSVPNPPVPCDAQRPVSCVAPNPIATTTTTVQANGAACSLQTCVASPSGTTPTPTVTAVSGLFGSPSGSASGFIVNGIKSGLSFYLIIAGVLIVGTVIIIRIAKAK